MTHLSAAAQHDTGADFDAARWRADFPALHQVVNDRPLVYLDNAATTQKPQAVIDALRHYYEHDNANVHRGVHALSVRATEAYEHARENVRRFINAEDKREIVFVRGATEAVNLVAQTFGRAQVGAGDEIIISTMEHHSNIVPWQILCEQTGARLRVIPINDRGELDLAAYEALLNEKTRLVGIVHVSNALGTINPVRAMIERAHRADIPVLVDGCQATPHLAVDVQALDCDFYAFSGHKMFGPTGIGVLYGKRRHLEAMPPYQGGGEMISSVTFDKTKYAAVPAKFEAGTPNIAGTIGLGAAIEYLDQVGVPSIAAYEQGLLAYATQKLSAIPGLTLIGTAERKASVLSFTLEGIHPHDAGTIFDREGIAVRAGHHCTQPVMQHFGVPATCRASLAFYNTVGDVDALVRGIARVQEVFG